MFILIINYVVYVINFSINLSSYLFKKIYEMIVKWYLELCFFFMVLLLGICFLENNYNVYNNKIRDIIF